MKISAVPNLTNLAPPAIDQNTGSAVENLRSLKMRTNYNPSDYQGLAQQNAESLTNSPNNDQARVSEETQPLSPQYAALARQRRALQVKERALAGEREGTAQSTARPG